MSSQAEKKDNSTPTDEAGGGKKSKKKLMLIVALVALLLVGGGSAWFFMQKSAHAEQDTEEAAEAPKAKKKPKKGEPALPPVFVALDPFTVNLQPNRQFLQATFNLQVATAEEAATLKNYLPQIRSRLLLMLSGKTAEEISTIEGKNQLTKEILDLVNEPLASGMPSLDVANVFITSFVIQ